MNSELYTRIVHVCNVGSNKKIELPRLCYSDALISSNHHFRLLCFFLFDRTVYNRNYTYIYMIVVTTICVNNTTSKNIIKTSILYKVW
jgi:hypothetical protein